MYRGREVCKVSFATILKKKKPQALVLGGVGEVELRSF